MPFTDAWVLQFFTYQHLQPELRDLSKKFADLATELSQVLPANQESSVALRKLLEAKDAAIRAKVVEIRETNPAFPR